MHFMREWDSTATDILSPEQRLQLRFMLQQLMEKAGSTGKHSAEATIPCR